MDWVISSGFKFGYFTAYLNRNDYVNAMYLGIGEMYKICMLDFTGIISSLLH